MRVVIDIPEEDYRYIKELKSIVIARGTCKTIQLHVINAIKNGTPLKTMTDDVMLLYKRHQPYLATNVYKFGIELNALLRRYER